MTRHNFKNLYSASLKSRSLLNNVGSIKQTYEIVLDIKESGLKFNPGDCLAVIPENDPSIVALCIKHMKADASDQVIFPIKKDTVKTSQEKITSENDCLNKNLPKNDMLGNQDIPDQNDHKNITCSLKDYLTKKVNITRIKPALLKLLLKYASSQEKVNTLSKLLENKDELKSYLETHELWDTLKDFYSKNIPSQEICSTLLPMLPRLYSISSAYCLYPNEIHLTVSYVEYETSNFKRHGVASHFLCKLADKEVKVFIHPTHKFHLPENPSTPIIMIATGAGIAPFINFIQHRYCQKAQGKNWLFFGECNKAYDYYYETYLENLKSKNFLEITTAFSRDQKEKIYVQHRLIENKSKLWNWIQKGTMIYVCGDARKMAVDIDKALLSIFQDEGQMDENTANNFLKQLISEKRYLKDVY